MAQPQCDARTGIGWIPVASCVCLFGCVVWLWWLRTSLQSDVCVWMAVASPLWAGRFAIAFPAGGCESSSERSVMVSSFAP